MNGRTAKLLRKVARAFPGDKGEAAALRNLKAAWHRAAPQKRADYRLFLTASVNGVKELRP